MHRGNVPYGPMRSIVRMESATYDIDRKQPDTDQSYGTEQPYATNVTTADLALFDPNVTENQYPTGEIEEGIMRAIALPAADLQTADRFTHGGIRYEVTTIEQLPDEQETELILAALERVTVA